MITLKDGSTTEDINLDRIIEFDEKSKEYPITSILKSKKLRSYTWRCNAWFNQGQEGACVGFGITHELSARPAEVPSLSNSYARQSIYWEAQKTDPWDGGAYPGANPFYEGTSVLAGVKIAQKLGWFESYRWSFGLEDLILGVGHNGPAVMGLRWYENMYNPDQDGFIIPTGKCVGGHCILCNGVNIKEKRFTLHNSWGQTWGINGECYISFNAMEKLLNEQGEACFFIKRHKKIKKK